MTPTITVFADSPDRGQGLARDMRVRWALEEVGQPYDVRRQSFAELGGPEHLARNPFGQIPTYEAGSLALFESGAIVLHIATQHEGLLPAAPDARARAQMWLFAAINTIEPPIIELFIARVIEGDRPWAAERVALVKDRARHRLGQLAARLGGRDWLDGDFSAGDLMMVTVLMRAQPSGLLAEFSSLAGYVARGQARPAFARAFAAQRAIWESLQAAG